MPQRVIPVGHSLAPDSLTFDEAGNSLWAASVQGAVVTVRLLDRRVEIVGTGYRHPVAAIPGHDGLTVSIVERKGRIWHARRDHASRNQAQLIADLPGRALAASRHPDPGKLLVLTAVIDGAGGIDHSLVTVNLADGTTTTLASTLDNARTFVVDANRNEATVLAITPADARQLYIVGLDDGMVSPAIDVPLPFDTILDSNDPAQPGVIGAFADETTLGALRLFNRDGSQGASLDLGRAARGLARWGSLVLVASGTDLIAAEWDLDDGKFAVDTPLGPLYVNGYVRVPVDYAAAGLSLAEVEFSVREGSTAGSVSAGIEQPKPGAAASVMLLAGFLPGEYHLDARLKADGSMLVSRRFRVTACWPDEIVGPPVTITGPHQMSYLMSWGGAGGGPAYLKPAPEVLRVAVFLVSTKDRRWDGLEGAALNDWKARVVGDGTSAKTFYEEVSYRKKAGGPGASPGMTVELIGDRVFGPIDLDEGWGDIFKPKTPGDVDAGWLTKPTGKEVLANAVSSFMADEPNGANLMALADSIVIITRSATDAPTTVGKAPPIPTQYVWGHATRGTSFWRKTPTTFTQGPKPVTFMTDVYPAALLPKPPILEHTLCHELGHNIGLDDLYDAQGDYPAEINARTPDYADLMATSRPLPHFSLANRMRLGWIKPAWLRRFDFSASPTGGTVSLYSIERLTRNGPPPGYFAGIEVPIQDGASYLFEMRRKQDGQVGDQQLKSLTATEALILGTDLKVGGGEPARPPILFLPTDADGDGPVLDAAGEDYEDSDVTNPARMHDFTVTLQSIGSIDADAAVVRVDYVAAHRPQLQIRPAPGRGNFKSPDIDLLGPFGAPLPKVIKGAPNKVQITVHNLGTLKATKVQIHVKWLPFTVSAGDWQPLPDPVPFDVPALGSTSIAMVWVLPESVKVGDDEAEHFCLRVDIDRFIDPLHAPNNEIVVFDNWAQSNFTTAAVADGSPSERIRTVATATNALARDATYLFTAEQSGEGYRIYVGHAWLRLASSATRALELAYESLAGDPVHGAAFEQAREAISVRPNHVAVTSWLVPENTECDTPREWWGVSLDLRAGRRVWFEDIRRNGELVTARVRGGVDGAIIDVTYGQAYLAVWPEEEPGRVAVTQGQIRLDGTLRVLLSNETLHALSQGSRIVGVLGRPGDGRFAAATSPPAALR